MGFQIPSYLKFLTDSNGGADAQVEGIFQRWYKNFISEDSYRSHKLDQKDSIHRLLEYIFFKKTRSLPCYDEGGRG